MWLVDKGIQDLFVFVPWGYAVERRRILVCFDVRQKVLMSSSSSASLLQFTRRRRVPRHVMSVNGRLSRCLPILRSLAEEPEKVALLMEVEIG